MPKKLTLIIGVILALAAIILIKVYLDQRSREAMKMAKLLIARERQNSSAVLIAKKAIPRGTTISADMLEVAIVPNDYVQSGAATSADSIAGMKAAVDIIQNQQISKNMLVVSREETPSAIGSSLAMTIPVGKRAFTVSVDTLSSVGGMLRPGDYIDVIALIHVPVQGASGKPSLQVTSVPLFQNILVLAVGQDIGFSSGRGPGGGGRYEDKEPKKEALPIITLSLSPQEANLVTFVLEQGAKLKMILRSPADAQVQSPQPADWNTVFQYLMPHYSAKEEKPTEEEPPRRKVDIYRGTKKEEIYLSK